MFEPGPESVKTRERGSLNTAQRRRLSITCMYIDNLLSEIEHALHSASSQSPFPRYVLDVTPRQSEAIEEHIARLLDQKRLPETCSAAVAILDLSSSRVRMVSSF